MCVRAGVSVVLQFGVKRAFCAPHTVDAQQAEQQQNAEPHEHGAEDGGPEAAGGSVEEQEETTAPSEATRSTSKRRPTIRRSGRPRWSCRSG